MGKLADLVSEDLSFAEKMKINLRKVGLAGVGLASIVDTERTRLYRQITDLGEAYGAPNTVVGRISLLGTGTVNFVLEESLRVFDELVEEGEQALDRNHNRSKTPAPKSEPRKVTQPRPVAKSKAPQSPALKAAAKPQPTNKPRLSEALKQRLEQAGQALEGLELTSQQKLEVNALARQVSEGDVKGRRPAKTKPDAQAEFDARRLLKGMKAEEALKRLEAQVQRLTPEAVN